MDRKQLEMMLQLAEDKKRELESVISTIKEQLTLAGARPSRRRRRASSSELGEVARKIKECLEEAKSFMSPAKIHRWLIQTGLAVTPARVRNVLKKYRDIEFESPAHGQWKIKGKLLMAEITPGASKDYQPLTPERDDDSPF